MVVPVPSQQNKAKFRGINFRRENCDLLGGSYEIYEMYEICSHFLAPLLMFSLRIHKAGNCAHMEAQEVGNSIVLMQQPQELPRQRREIE